jgi:DNA-binding beta-propeller fold protein YncE
MPRSLSLPAVVAIALRRLARGLFVATTLPLVAGAQTPEAPAKPPRESEAQQQPPTVAAVLYSTRGDEKVHLLSLPELKPLHVYDAGAGAHELAISADGRYALGSAYGGPGKGHQPADNRVFVLDLPSGKRSRMVDLGDSKRPNDLAFVGTTTTAWLTTEVPAQLVRLDAATGAFTVFPLEHKTNHMLALAPDGSSCFVSHVVPGGVTRFDLATNKATAHASLPEGAEGIACVAKGDGVQLWIGCNRGSKLVVVDGKTLQVVHEVARDGFPLRVKASPDGKQVAVSCPLSGEVVLYDTNDIGKAKSIDLGKELARKAAPTSLGFSPDGSQLLVVVAGDTQHVVALDTKTLQVTAKIEAAGPIADALVAGMVQAPR